MYHRKQAALWNPVFCIMGDPPSSADTWWRLAMTADNDPSFYCYTLYFSSGSNNRGGDRIYILVLSSHPSRAKVLRLSPGIHTVVAAKGTFQQPREIFYEAPWEHPERFCSLRRNSKPASKFKNVCSFYARAHCSTFNACYRFFSFPTDMMALTQLYQPPIIHSVLVVPSDVRTVPNDDEFV